MCEDDAGEVCTGAANTETSGGSFCEISAVGSAVAPPTWAENDEQELVALKSGHGDVDGTLAEIEVLHCTTTTTIVDIYEVEKYEVVAVALAMVALQ